MFMILFVWLPLGLFVFKGFYNFVNAIGDCELESDEDKMIDQMREEWNRKNL